MVTVKSIMTKHVISVKETTPITQAIQLLLQHDISGLPVVNVDMKLMGIVTEKDIFKVLYKKIPLEKPVRDIMTKEVVSFNENDSVADVCRRFVESQFRRVPILSDGKVVGLVARREIIRCILAMHEQEEATRPKKKKDTEETSSSA